MRKGVEVMIQVDAFEDGDERVMSPPLAPVAVIIIAIACLLQWLQPIQIIADIAFIEDIDPDSLSLVGLVVAIAGLSLSVSGFHALKSRGGVVNPLPLPKMLVTDGVFRWTRNPGYLGMLIALFGVALIFAFDWLLILIVPTWVILNLAVVRHEELYLQQRFGRAYLDYTKRTPRYFFIH
jgi:protein-S-isoprenylcysteine O-methyltransferase Ste14